MRLLSISKFYNLPEHNETPLTAAALPAAAAVPATTAVKPPPPKLALPRDEKLLAFRHGRSR